MGAEVGFFGNWVRVSIRFGGGVKSHGGVEGRILSHPKTGGNRVKFFSHFTKD